MKIVSRATHFAWLIALLIILSITSSIADLGFSSAVRLSTYDGQYQARTVYDGGFLLFFAYDFAAVPTVGGETNPTAETSRFFGKSAEFLAAETVAPRINVLPSSGNRFLVGPGGDAIIVPRGASGPVPIINQGGRTTGFGFTGGSGGLGLDSRVSNVRIMDATLPRGPSPGYPAGYVNYQNIGGQSVNPFTGQTIAPNNPLWHMPLTPP